MKKIIIAGTGGTIASRNAGAGAVATDGVKDILSALGAWEEELTLVPVDIIQENSFNFTLKHLRLIAARIKAEMADPEVIGAVVTHGTDLIEETAFFLDLVWDDPRPVVFTGAQHSADSPEYDGPRNLKEAIAVAADPRMRDQGVLVSFAGKVFLARGTYKIHTLSLSPFRSFCAGKVATFKEGKLKIKSGPWPRYAAPFSVPGEDIDERVRVDIIPVYPGLRPEIVECFRDNSAILFAGTGAGNCSRVLLPFIDEAIRRGVLVGLSTRVPSGPVMPIYGNGGAVDVLALGAISMADLPTTQARILLAVAAYGRETESAAKLIREYVDWFSRHWFQANHEL